MPAKHSSRPFNTARMVMSFAMAILVLLVVWVAVRAVGPAEASRQPAVALPSMPQVAVEPAASASSVPPSPAGLPQSGAVSSSPVASRSVSSSPSASVRRGATPGVPGGPSTGVPEGTRRPTTKPTPTAQRTTTAAPAPSFAVSISVSGSWQFGYKGRVTIQNNGNAAGDWRITVAHSDVDNLRLFSVWGARGSLEGDNVVFTGGSLKPGASAGFQYTVTKTGRGNARPSGCSVVGGTCRVG